MACGTTVVQLFWNNLLINKQLHRKVRGSGFINYGNVCSSYIGISIWHLTATLAWVHPIDSSTYCRCYLMCMIRKQLRPTYREHFLGQQGKLSELAWLPAGPGFINVCINTWESQFGLALPMASYYATLLVMQSALHRMLILLPEQLVWLTKRVHLVKHTTYLCIFYHFAMSSVNNPKYYVTF